MANKSSNNWPFDDKTQLARMAKALGRSADPNRGSDASRPARLRVRSHLTPKSVGDSGRPTVALGYHPDLPDHRDHSLAHLSKADLAELGKRLPQLTAKANLPSQVNNIAWCSPVEDQGSLGSCTAQAVVGMMEYMQRRSGKAHVDGSRLFVYKVSRKLQGWTGDTGSYLRTAIKAVAAFGIPPEQYWPYVIDKFEEEPTAFLYAFATNYQALNYTRLDPPGSSGKDTLAAVKKTLASGLGVVFGFSVYSSLTNAGDIPFPTENDKLTGGHAVMAVGYDDDHGQSGALLIRNSWGPGWGFDGYGYLPYEYIEQGLAQDFWTVLKSEWLDLEQFGK
jgi:C1A family cysteine protease